MYQVEQKNQVRCIQVKEGGKENIPIPRLATSVATMMAPASFGSSQVESAYVLQGSQKLPWFGKRSLRGLDGVCGLLSDDCLPALVLPQASCSLFCGFKD
jgi:hypothetical protein